MNTSDQIVALAREAEQLTTENIELRHKLQDAREALRLLALKYEASQSASRTEQRSRIELLQRAESTRRERDARERELMQVIEHDRSSLADGVKAVKDVLESYMWLGDGRGPYEWDDDRWHDEFKHLVADLRSALVGMQQVIADLSNSPMSADEVIAARTEWKQRAERAERALAEARQGWIPVGEYLPENYEQVLCLLRKVDFPRTRYTLAWCKRGSWFGLICSLDGTAQNGEIPDGEITHWRPLPAPPEVK